MVRIKEAPSHCHCSCPSDSWRRRLAVFLMLSAVSMPLLADDLVAVVPPRAAGIMPRAVPMMAPVITTDTVPRIAPPPLLDPDTRPDTFELPPLVEAPAITMSEPIPMARARNCISRDNAGRFVGWMDYQHCVFSGRTLAGARWFDDLFGDWYDSEARLLVRVITESTFAESQTPDTVLRVRASAELPNAKKRMRLVISNDSDLEGRVVGQDVLSRLSDRSSQVSAALRLVPVEKKRLKSDLDVGVRGLNPPDFFARVRVRDYWNLTQDSIFRFGQTFRYGSDSKGRSITQVDLENVVSEDAVARFSSGYEYNQKDDANGFGWGHGVSMSHVLGNHRSLGYGFTLSGHTSPNWRGENYGPWMVYRTSFLRPWLFCELEPRLTWYRDQNWNSLASIVIRIEVQIGKK